jgi:hypothetical protein
MDSFSSKGSQLQQDIEREFARVPRPADTDLARSNPASGEARQVVAFLRGKDWRALTPDALLNEYVGDYRAILNFLSPAAFHYYLPAFLLLCLDADREVGQDAAAYVFQALTYPGAGSPYEQRFGATVAGLTSEQRKVVVDVLHLLDDEWTSEGWEVDDPPNPGREALDSYWERKQADPDGGGQRTS